MTDTLLARLRAAGLGDLLADDANRSAYASDASLYRVVPRAIVRPRDDDEVAATLEVCRSLGVPVTARGAGTSIAGNAIGPGVVLDFSRHMNRVLSLDLANRLACVEAGVTNLAISQAVARSNRALGRSEPVQHRA